jgi:hypothetical protein
MDEELKHRFIRQKIEDFVTDNVKPFPTIICERDDPRLIDLVRQFCLFSTKMIPFKGKLNLLYVSEGLEIQRESIVFGDLYIEVFVN